jgi:hypothetical protein
MHKNTAIGLATESMERRRQTYYAFDYNLGQQGVRSPAITRATRHYERLTEAIEILEGMKDEPK